MIMLRRILYLVCLCPCLGLCLFILYLCDLFFNFSLIFIAINHLTTFKQRYGIFVLLEYLLLFLDDNMDEESEQFSNSKSSASGRCLAFS